MNLNIKLYQTLKEKNKIKITRISKDLYAFIVEQYDANTGERGDDIVDQFSLSKLQAALAQSQAEVDGINAILADVTQLSIK